MFEKIEEIKSVHEALKRISYNTWLVLDLDNTVMESNLELGGDQWFTSLMTHIELSGAEKEIACQAAIAIYHAVQEHIRTKAVEPQIVSVISALQEIGIPVLALTARDRCMRFTTMRQLDDIGINFSRNPIELLDGTFLEQGIIFCSGLNKGEALRTFLLQCANRPIHIAMWDDKMKYLQQVQAAVEPLGIQFNGLRYGFLDEKVLRFNKSTASCQLAHLKKRLPRAVQDKIDEFQIIPVELPVAYSPSSFAHGFFDNPTDSTSTVQFLSSPCGLRKKQNFFRSYPHQADLELSREVAAYCTREADDEVSKSPD